MKSISIHNLDDPLDTLLRKRARQQGTSLNKTIQALLKQSLGIAPKASTGHREEFRDLCGVWSATEVEELKQALGDFEKVDSGDWA